MGCVGNAGYCAADGGVAEDAFLIGNTLVWYAVFDQAAPRQVFYPVGAPAGPPVGLVFVFGGPGLRTARRLRCAGPGMATAEFLRMARLQRWLFGQRARSGPLAGAKQSLQTNHQPKALHSRHPKTGARRRRRKICRPKRLAHWMGTRFACTSGPTRNRPSSAVQPDKNTCLGAGPGQAWRKRAYCLSRREGPHEERLGATFQLLLARPGLPTARCSRGAAKISQNLFCVMFTHRFIFEN